MSVEDRLRAASEALALLATATGQETATAAPPARTTFSGVTASADQRTLVLSAARYPDTSRYVVGQGAPAVGWYAVRLTGDRSGLGPVTALAVPATPRGWLLDGFSLSPDGSELAVLTHQALTSEPAAPASLTVYSVATGRAVRSWLAARGEGTFGNDAGAAPDNSTVRWLAGGRALAFTWTTQRDDKIKIGGGRPDENSYTETIQIRRVSLDRTGSDLTSGSSVVTALSKAAVGVCMALQPTGDGQGGLCGTQSQASAALGPGTYSERPVHFYGFSGRPADGPARQRLLGRVPPGTAECGDRVADVLWVSPSGSVLVGIVYTVLRSRDPAAGYPTVIGVLSEGRWTALPNRVLYDGPFGSPSFYAF